MSTAGTGLLLRFDLRRDRLMLLWWVLGVVVLYWSQAVSTEGLYPTQAELDKAAQAMAGNTAFVALAGPARALNTVGGQVAWQASAFGAIVAGLMSMFLVGRHTRVEEETGRDELVRATAVGRHAPTLAAALVVLVANVLLGGLVAASLVGYGLAVAGSVSLGLAAALAGLVFGAVALVAVQLAGTARAAYGITGAVIAASYVLRAVGDVTGGGLSILSMLSPIGWGQSMHAFSGERWWPALLSVAAVAVLGVVAVRLLDRRDHGAGIRAARPGPATAGGDLRGTVGLAWRLQRGTLLGWTVGLLATGLSYGAIGDSTDDLVGNSQLAEDLFGGTGPGATDLFYAALVAMLALLAAGFAIASAGRPASEEGGGRVDLLLAGPVTRARWALSHLAVTVGGTVVVLFAGGVGLAVGFGLSTGDWATGGRLLGATLPYVAPVLVLAAVAWFGWAVRPRLVPAGWLALAYCAVVMLFGETLQLPGWAMSLSPLEQLPAMPADAFEALPVAALLLVAGALATAGLVALRRRDLG